ncbi:MAG: hypothetical protein DRH06_08785 [Deltaproteobacteria bacterium]|nr:MAG: hypothetical protein DRH06_08785 [Deltaproteobacteria bacterium]
MSYTGRWVKIDLTTKTYEINNTDQTLVENYIGGKGLGFAILDKIAPAPEALGEDNPLIFVNGPFTGSEIQTSARTTLVTKSPLTNSILDSHCGGHFGPQLKAAEFDYMVIVGKAKSWIYLYVTKDGVEFKSAEQLKGKGIFYVNDWLIDKHPGNDPRVACIGIAGENLSRLAGIGVDKHRQFGRGGAGAVMGSKMLKAIVVDGELRVHYHDAEKFRELNKKLTKDILSNPSVKYRRQKGTMLWVRRGQELGVLPARNFKECGFDDFEKISSETAKEELNWKDTSCFNCAIRCSKIATFDGHQIEGPEYETTAYLGSGCMVNDIKKVAMANELCNDLGMDTISVGVTISFAMECYEKKLLDNWDGLDLSWGNAEAQYKLIQLMAQKKGIGAIFGDGTKRAAEIIGKGSDDFAINTFGMELSGVNPKGSLIMSLMLSVADFASHTRLWCLDTDMEENFTIDEIPATVAKGIDDVNVRNSLVICDFVPEGVKRLAELLNAATGYEHTEDSLHAIGAKITNLARAYNLRNGRTHTDDTLPNRFFDEGSLAGFMKGKKLDRGFFKSLIQQYYKLRNWNQNGEPEAVETISTASN